MEHSITPPETQIPLTEAALCRWFGAANTGDTIIYHRGALARQLCAQLNLLSEIDRVRLARIAGRAWALAEADAHEAPRREGRGRAGAAPSAWPVRRSLGTREREDSMSQRASLALLAALSVLGWIGVMFGLALTWVAGRFFATLLGWA